MLAAVAAAMLVLGGGGALASALRSGSGVGHDSGTPATPPPATTGPAPSRVRSTALRGVEIAVLNATTRPGAARAVGELLERHRATITTVGTYVDQALERTTIRYRRSESLARRVAGIIGAGDVRSLSGAPAVSPGGAEIVVVVGYDGLRP